jgi:hypothetical protein
MNRSKKQKSPFEKQMINLMWDARHMTRTQEPMGHSRSCNQGYYHACREALRAYRREHPR